MPRCASTKNKKTDDQCPHNALRGHAMCGHHRSVKVPRLWAAVVKDRVAPLARFQAIFRGWKIRKYLAVCGPGVLRRAACVNDEELVTLESKNRQHPFDYFGLEEAGKIWWFDFCTLWDWSVRSVTPTNPYTNVELSHEAKQRIKVLWAYRRRKGMPLASESGVPTTDRIFRRWTAVCQIFRFYGFEDVHPNMFVDLTKENLVTMFRFLTTDLNEMHKKPHRILAYCTRGLQSARHLAPNSYIMTSLNALVFMLMDTNAYDFVFMVLSALYRC